MRHLLRPPPLPLLVLALPVSQTCSPVRHPRRCRSSSISPNPAPDCPFHFICACIGKMVHRLARALRAGFKLLDARGFQPNEGFGKTSRQGRLCATIELDPEIARSHRCNFSDVLEIDEPGPVRLDKAIVAEFVMRLAKRLSG